MDMKQAGKPAYYVHNNGDKDYILVLKYEENTDRYWVRWADGFVNMVSAGKVEFIDD